MVSPFDLQREPELRRVLDACGYALCAPPPHARLQAAGEGIRVTLYESGKLLLQGKREREVWEELAAFGLVGGGERDGGAGAGAGGRSGAGAGSGGEGGAAAGEALIGTDEVGKGDYFGPLVVAAVLVEPGRRAALARLGVRDSKMIGDGPVRKLAAEIRRACPHEVVVISPKRYNEMYESFRNVNRLLAWAHARAIESLLAREPGCTHVLTDQFASDPAVLERALGERGRRVKHDQRARGEEELAVAAASIVARAAFLEKITELSDLSGMVLPKGASARVEAAARAFVAKHGRERLGEVAKLHFQTTERVLG